MSFVMLFFAFCIAVPVLGTAISRIPINWFTDWLWAILMMLPVLIPLFALSFVFAALSH